jgi:hypothetical protein
VNPRLERPDASMFYVVIDCAHCAGDPGVCRHTVDGSDTDNCCQCDGAGELWEDLSWALRLAIALGAAGALCASFEAGWQRANAGFPGDGMCQTADDIDNAARAWEPGCGRTFPEDEGETSCAS